MSSFACLCLCLCPKATMAEIVIAKRDRSGGQTGSESAAASKRHQSKGRRTPVFPRLREAGQQTDASTCKEPRSGGYHVTVLLEPLNSPD